MSKLSLLPEDLPAHVNLPELREALQATHIEGDYAPESDPDDPDTQRRLTRLYVECPLSKPQIRALVRSHVPTETEGRRALRIERQRMAQRLRPLIRQVVEEVLDERGG